MTKERDLELQLEWLVSDALRKCRATARKHGISLAEAIAVHQLVEQESHTVYLERLWRSSDE